MSARQAKKLRQMERKLDLLCAQKPILDASWMRRDLNRLDDQLYLLKSNLHEHRKEERTLLHITQRTVMFSIGILSIWLVIGWLF